MVDRIFGKSKTGPLKTATKTQAPIAPKPAAPAPTAPPPPAVPNTTGQRTGEMTAFTGSTGTQMPWEQKTSTPPAQTAPSTQAPPAPASTASPTYSQVAQAVLAQLAAPEKEIRQVFATSCMAASLQVTLAMSKPAEYQAFAESLWNTGAATLNGHSFRLDPQVLSELKSKPGATVTERLNMVVQAALMELANGGARYEHSTSMSVDASGNRREGLTVAEASTLATCLGLNFFAPQVAPAPGETGQFNEQIGLGDGMQGTLSQPSQEASVINSSGDLLPRWAAMDSAIRNLAILPSVVTVPSSDGTMRHAVVVYVNPKGGKYVLDPMTGEAVPCTPKALADLISAIDARDKSIGGNRTQQSGGGGTGNLGGSTPPTSGGGTTGGTTGNVRRGRNG